MTTFSQEDAMLIKNLYLLKGYGTWRLSATNLVSVPLSQIAYWCLIAPKKT